MKEFELISIFTEVEVYSCIFYNNFENEFYIASGVTIFQFEAVRDGVKEAEEAFEPYKLQTTTDWYIDDLCREVDGLLDKVKLYRRKQKLNKLIK